MARPEAPKAIAALEPADVEAIERALGTLFRLSRNFRFQEAVHQRSGFTADRASYGLLARVGELQPVRLSDLAHVLGVDVSTTSRQVAALEQRGLLSRSADPVDGRAVRLDLTTAGQAYLEKLSQAWHEIVAEALVDWHPDEVAEFAEMIDRFVANLASSTQPPHASGQ